MIDQRVSLRDYIRGFSKPFGASNSSEPFERIAFYGMAPVGVRDWARLPARESRALRNQEI